ncbi:ankyrin repeat domain-containing protein [Planctomycetota bacterium]
MNGFLSLSPNMILSYLFVGSATALIVVMSVWGIIKLAKIRTPVVRHMIWQYALIGIVILPIIWIYGPKLTVAVLPAPTETIQEMSPPPVDVGSVMTSQHDPLLGSSHENLAPIDMPQQTMTDAPSYPAEVFVVGIWFLGFALMIVRLGFGWYRLHQICRNAKPTSVPEFQPRIEKYNARLLLTPHLNGPVCFGVFRPVILLPQDMTEKSAPQDLHMVLTHELAHITRWDCWANLFQRLVEATFFFHPCVWLASWQLTQEREHICDNHVLTEGACAHQYSSLLSQIGERACKRTSLVSVALFEGQLLSRIRSLLDPTRNRRIRVPGWIATACTLIALLGIVMPGSIRLEAKSTVTETPNQANETGEEITPIREMSLATKDEDLTTVKPPVKSLHQAAADGDIDWVKQLIAQGADVNAKDENDQTVLHRAVENGQRDVAELLIASGAEVNAGGKGGGVALLPAIFNDDLDMVRMLLDKGANCNVHDNGGSTPLTWAVTALGEKDKDIVTMLINSGANINLGDKKGGRTPLYWAAFQGSNGVFDIFLAQVTDPNTIHLAALKGDLARVKAFVQSGADINTRDKFGCTLLHWAATAKTNDVADFLTAEGADVNTKDNNGLSPLLGARRLGMIELLVARGANVDDKGDSFGHTKLNMACLKQDMDIATFLISKGADVNTKNNWGIRPLQNAIRNGQKDIVELLISKGADVNVSNNAGVTPLDMAEEIGNTEISELLRKNGAKKGSPTLFGAVVSGDIEQVKLLIDNGADVDAKNIRRGATPLHLAAIRGSQNVVELLIASGANVNAQDKQGNTPLDLAKRRGNAEIVEILTKAAEEQKTTEKEPSVDDSPVDSIEDLKSLNQAAADGDIDRVKQLIAEGTDVNTEYQWGETALHVAAANSHEEIAELLIANGANIDANKPDYTPLTWAVWNDDVDMTKILVTHGANVNYKKANDIPAFFYCFLIDGGVELAELFVSHGAKLDMKDNGGCTVFQHSVGAGRQDLVEYFLGKGFKAPAFHLAAFRGDLDLVKNFIDEGMDVDTKDEYGWTPLYWACSAGQEAVGKYLLDKGAKADATTEGGGTPLHKAAGTGAYRLAELLISKGADVNARANKEKTPLHIAAGAGHSRVVELLVKHGADVNARPDQKSYTPLHLAVGRGHKDVVEILVANGADVNRGRRGQSVLEMAIKNGNIEIVEFLKKHGAR